MNASAVALSPPAISSTIPRLSVVNATGDDQLMPSLGGSESAAMHLLPMLMNTIATLIKTCRRCENGCPG